MTDLYKIKSEACEFFGISIESFDSEIQTREIVKARYMAMVAAKNHTKYTRNIIGQVMGDKDHSTVEHAIKTVKNLCETDEDYAQEFRDFDNRIKLLFKNRDKFIIKATIILKESQLREDGYYFLYKKKDRFSLLKIVNIVIDSISSLDQDLDLNQIEFIEIKITDKRPVKNLNTFKAVNKRVEIEI